MIKNNSKMRSLDLTPTPEILSVLESVNITPIQCVAELVDNCLDNFQETKNEAGLVTIEVDGTTLRISDNGSGMSVDTLEKSLKAGFSSKSKIGQLGLFGVGFNVACARLGRVAWVTTKVANEKEWKQVKIDLDEMVKTQSFRVEPKIVGQYAEMESGTVIEIELNKQHLTNFNRPKYLADLSIQLGRIYTYILRDGVPGLSGKSQGSPLPIQIIVDKKAVKPHLPCIWSEKRSTTYNRDSVEAVQYFDVPLGDASVCENCGSWENASSGSCEICGSRELQITSRSVWGWVGVQRFLDTNKFGLDFIRNGRTIKQSDKNIFEFEDPDSGAVDREYPIEMPAERGRIVGEVHCDHVSVDLVKTNFVDGRQWDGAIKIVRGETALKPRGRREINESPLAIIYSTFRRNDPGFRYLTPGNGDKANFNAAKNWGDLFYAGNEEYFTDQYWYDAVKSHEDKKKRGDNDLLDEGKKGGSDTTPTFSPVPSGEKPTVPSLTKTPEKKETTNERAGRLTAGGIKRYDLSKEVSFKSMSNKYQLEFWETSSSFNSEGNSNSSTLCITLSGNHLQIFGYTDAEALTKYGRSIADLMLMEAAAYIKSTTGSPLAIGQIFTELLENYPDEESSEKTIKNRIREINERIGAKSHKIITGRSTEIWDSLPDDERSLTEENYFSGKGEVVWDEVVKRGGFSRYLRLSAFEILLKEKPELFFDGNLFQQHYATAHAESARERSVGYIVRAIRDLVMISKLKVNLNLHY